MYGKSSIFTRSSVTGNAPAYNGGNVGNNGGGNGYNVGNNFNGGYNGNGYNSNFNNGGYNNGGGYNNSSGDYRQNGGKLGSYRTEYKYEQPPAYIVSAVPVWKDYPPASILSKEELLHFTPAELRLEDYYQMRKRNLRPMHEERLREAIRKQCFNQQLLKFDGVLPPISQERGEDIDALRSNRFPANNNYNSGYNQNVGYNNGYNNSGGSNNSGGFNNSNGYNTRGNDANIFNRNSNSSTNVFMNNNANNSANAFNGNRNGTNNGGYNSGGYNGGNSGGYNGGNGQNNIFDNNGYNNSGNQNYGNSNLRSNNVFANNGNNVSGGNNVFNSNANRNPFANNGGNNGAGNNLFNQGNNNRNVSAGNGAAINIFANNNNGGNNAFGNGNSRNLFGNSAGQNNNLFGNNMNNNLFGNNPNVVDNLQQFLQENRQFLQILSQKISEQNPPSSPSPPPPPLYEPLFKEDDHELFEIDSWVKPEPPPERVITINKSEKYHDTMSEGGGRSQFRENMGSSRQTSNGGRKITYSRVVNKSYKIEEEQHSQSGVGYNIPASEANRNEKGMAQSRRLEESSRMMGNQKSMTGNNRVISNQPQYLSLQNGTGQFQVQNSIDPSLVSESACQCRIKLSIVWEDDLSSGMREIQIQETTQRPNFKPNDTHWQRQLINSLKERHPYIRKNSQLVLINCSIDPSNQQYILQGQLRQKIFNIEESYRVNYSLLRNSFASNLSISNQHGTVWWERPINVEQIDFKDEDQLTLDDNTISCDLSALKGKCRVTFNNVPQTIKTKMAEDFQAARSHFAGIVEKHSDGRFRLQDIWKEGEIYGWSMMVTAFSE